MAQARGAVEASEVRVRAAQYIRMSSEQQRYSTANQALAIAAYAIEHDLEIVQSYIDKARSGLTIKGRSALQQLLHDVKTAQADYKVILVFDVSRWGRFQDADEAAHYEFICRNAGVSVQYCAEQFDNDGSFMSNIAKQLKRIGAGQYSLDLSKKVFAAQCRLVTLGFRQGGSAGYGLRRELVDAAGRSKGFLANGQRKALQEDRVLLRPGTPEEQEVVQRIFRSFVEERKCPSSIAKELNGEGILNQFGRRWTSWTLRYLLKNEHYIGVNVYNRSNWKLGQKPKRNPPEAWIRSQASFAPIVKPALFWKAQKISSRRRLLLSDRDMLDRLKALLVQKGELSKSIIDASFDLPGNGAYIKRFGSLRKAYAAIGYFPDSLRYQDGRRAVIATLVEVREEFVDELVAFGHSLAFDPKTGLITIDRAVKVTIAVARASIARGKFPRWGLRRRIDPRADLVVVARMDEDNREVMSYVVLPPARLTGAFLLTGERTPGNINNSQLATLEEAVESVLRFKARKAARSPAKGRPKSGPRRRN
ncbi:recombinase family protein [Bradyrhizobium sp. DOA9]|uniref:recombinase family protein n=1 Tax=Bradyrhizobium sp. DOA9 TaxID=1126627 RepID=UPI000468F884|nr:recombinase family protein [Bradyrhizobium sp. DOA9]